MAKKRSPDFDSDLLVKEYADLESDLKPRKASPGAKIKEKVSGATGAFLVAVKFVLGVCLLPFVFSGTGAFLAEFQNFPAVLQRFFWAGTVMFLISHLFIWEPGALYVSGQKLLSAVFSFFTPLVKIAPQLLPIYTLLVFAAYGIVSMTVKEPWVGQYGMFFAGATLAMHLVFSARSVKTKKSDFLKANYIFSFSLIYIINLVLISGCLNMITRDYSFLHFCATTWQGAHAALSGIFEQLFMRR